MTPVCRKNVAAATTLTMATSKKDADDHGIDNGYRSGLEDTVAAQIAAAGLSVKYEDVTFSYIKPMRPSRYTPDFVLPNGIIIETKGRFITADRQKHKWISEQQPRLDIRFVFSRMKTRISKVSKTTYQMWCDKNGFLCADKLIPTAWLKAPFCKERWAAIERAVYKKVLKL